MLLNDRTQEALVERLASDERKNAEEDVTELVKAALVISWANRNMFAKLKEELANNYLLGMDQHPDTFEQVIHILGNYQVSKSNRPFKGDGTKSGLAFL